MQAKLHYLYTLGQADSVLQVVGARYTCSVGVLRVLAALSEADDRRHIITRTIVSKLLQRSYQSVKLSVLEAKAREWIAKTDSHTPGLRLTSAGKAVVTALAREEQEARGKAVRMDLPARPKKRSYAKKEKTSTTPK